MHHTCRFSRDVYGCAREAQPGLLYANLFMSGCLVICKHCSACMAWFLKHLWACIAGNYQIGSFQLARPERCFGVHMGGSGSTCLHMVCGNHLLNLLRDKLYTEESEDMPTPMTCSAATTGCTRSAVCSPPSRPSREQSSRLPWRPEVVWLVDRGSGARQGEGSHRRQGVS